jgi:Asp-tRNA(Asn)/Glu-tRNA(Gln) amidotransferase A subunit family amidase
MATDLLWRSATEQAQLVRDGEVSSRELVEESLRAIVELNDELNAFVTTAAERAPACRSRSRT